MYVYGGDLFRPSTALCNPKRRESKMVCVELAKSGGQEVQRGEKRMVNKTVKILSLKKGKRDESQVGARDLKTENVVFWKGKEPR